jgi:hypothetical protein
MGNLGYLLRDWLERIFSVEIIRSRNVFHLKGVFTRYRNQIFDGVNDSPRRNIYPTVSDNGKYGWI